MKSLKYRFPVSLLGVAALIASQTGGLGAFSGCTFIYSNSAGHLSECGSGDNGVTAWTYARYYGGAFYGGGPDRKSDAWTYGWDGSQLDIRGHYDNIAVAVTYVSTGSLWESSETVWGASFVDTDLDNDTDAFNGNGPTDSEAWAYVE